MNARSVDLRAVVALSTTILLTACETVGFYRQAVAGHLSLMQARKPIPDVVSSPRTPIALRDRLSRIDEILDHARDVLALDPGNQFGSYADVHRESVVWNVFSAPEFAVRPHQWCYPLIGCAAYRGYFEERRAHDAATRMRARGFDAGVSGSPAYSSLGWFDDPVLSTFIGWDEPALAGLIFHELAHKRLFIAGDTSFNESFATFVERQGVRSWLSSDAPRLERYEKTWRSADTARAKLLEWRERLDDVYALPISAPAKRQLKGEMLRSMLDCFSTLPDPYEASRLTQFVGERPDNATFVPVAQYFGWVQAFEALFARSDADWTRFYQAASEIGELRKPDRQETLRSLSKDRADEARATKSVCPTFSSTLVSAAP